MLTDLLFYRTFFRGYRVWLRRIIVIFFRDTRLILFFLYSAIINGFYSLFNIFFYIFRDLGYRLCYWWSIHFIVVGFQYIGYTLYFFLAYLRYNLISYGYKIKCSIFSSYFNRINVNYFRFYVNLFQFPISVLLLFYVFINYFKYLNPFRMFVGYNLYSGLANSILDFFFVARYPTLIPVSRIKHYGEWGVDFGQPIVYVILVYVFVLFLLAICVFFSSIFFFALFDPLKPEEAQNHKRYKLRYKSIGMLFVMFDAVVASKIITYGSIIMFAWCYLIYLPLYNVLSIGFDMHWFFMFNFPMTDEAMNVEYMFDPVIEKYDNNFFMRLPRKFKKEIFLDMQDYYITNDVQEIVHRYTYV